MKKPGYGSYLILAIIFGLLILLSYLTQRHTSQTVEHEGHEHSQIQMAVS